MMQARTISLLTIVFSFLLLALGAVVHHFGSLIDCSTWPICYADQSHVSVYLSNAHRYLGVAVGLFMMLLVWTCKKGKSLDAYHASLFAFVFLVIQGALGAVTAIYRLPTIVSTSHFVLSIIFLSSLLYIHHNVKEKFFISSHSSLKWSLQTTDTLSIGIFFAFTAAILGAFVRHSNIMGSCGLGLSSAFLCDGSVWPARAQSQVHMFLRYYSFFSWAIVAYSLVKVFLNASESDLVFLKKETIYTATLVSLSQILGFASIVFYLSPYWFSAYSIVNILSLMMLWKLFLSVKSIEESAWGKRIYSFGRDLISLAKPRLASLVMLTSLVGILLATKPVNFFTGLIGFISVFLVVAGGCALNCLIEIKVDSLMERTKDRPLPSGRMDPRTALIFGLLTSVIGLVFLFLFVNTVTALLAIIASTLYIFVYTPLKQKSVIALYVGAIPGAIPPVMGWTIVMGSMDLMAWFLFAFLFIWQIPHFMAISIYLAKDYGSAKIFVYPNEFGMKLTQLAILSFTVVLGVVAYFPVWSNLQPSLAFGRFSIFMSTIFVGLALRVFVIKYENTEELKYWAKAYFYGSIIYLPLILGALIVLK
jgi:protoheme IX farnesyltransferase